MLAGLKVASQRHSQELYQVLYVRLLAHGMRSSDVLLQLTAIIASLCCRRQLYSSEHAVASAEGSSLFPASVQ